MLKRMKRGQVSLEFMMVFAIMLILLLYSVQNVTFKEGSASAESMALQINLEEKNLANAISNAISQVYAQGPGAKSTTYVQLVYLRNSEMLQRGLNIEGPMIFITYGNYSSNGSGTYVSVIGTGTKLLPTGGNKNMFWSRALYQKVLYANSSLWNPLGSANLVSTPIYGIEINPNDLPSTLKIVVEWNPDSPDSWVFNATNQELRININPGG